MPSPEWVIVGRLRKSHGLRGEIIVEPITDAPGEVFSAGRVLFAGDAAGDPLLEPPSEGEVYLHELEGMRVELESGEYVGMVTSVFELPQGLALDVQRETGTVLVPFSEVFIHEVRRVERTVVIAPPPGLLD